MNPINIILLGLLLVSGYATQNKTQFIATEEWQEIREGQPIPQGLHVRINLQTGKKEAKLLEKEDNYTQSSASLSTVPGERLQDHGGGGSALPYDNIGKLKNAFENVPDSDFKYNEEELMKTDHKRYPEEQKEANVKGMTSSEFMAAVFKLFEELKTKEQTESTIKTQLDVFEDLLYLVQEIDNAIDFINRQGIEKIIWFSLNHTESSLKINGFNLFGRLAQNNPKVKFALFERNGGSILLTKLSQSIKSDEISAGLYAFGALVRNFAYAQSELLNPHSLSLLFDVLDKKIELRVRVKVIQLIADLLQDNEHSLSEAEIDTNTREIYETTLLIEHLRKLEYCKRVGEFFHQNKAGFVQDDNLTDKMVTALRGVRIGLCQETWSKCPLFRHTLLVLRNNLDTRLSEWSGDKDGKDYRVEIQMTINKFVEELYAKEIPKDEL